MSADWSGTATTRAARRVGDVRRGEYAETLADAFVRGELTRAELDARTELCLAAVTDADLDRLVADLPGQVPTTAEPPADPGSVRGVVHLVTKVAAFQLVLIAIAYALGVDLESELRSWSLIAFEIWAVGTGAGLGGALLLLGGTHASVKHGG